MRPVREKSITKRFLQSKVSIALLLILIFVFSHAVFNIYLKSRAANTEKTASLSRFSMLSERENFLSREVERLKTTSGLEREIRDKYNVKKPGEEVAIIVDSTSSPQGVEATPSFFEKAWAWLKNSF